MIGNEADARRALTETQWRSEGYGDCEPDASPEGWEIVGFSSRVVLRPIGGSVVYKIGDPYGEYQNPYEVAAMSRLIAAGSPMAVPCSLYTFDDGATVVAMEYVDVDGPARDFLTDSAMEDIRRRLVADFDIHDSDTEGNLVMDKSGQVRLVDAGV